MTTIAASRELLLMAADSAQMIGDRAELSPSKLHRYRDFIVGLAGDNKAIERFVAWLSSGRKGKRPAGDYEAMLLYRDGRLTTFTTCQPSEEEIAEPYYSIGGGEDFALAALDAMAQIGLPPDPRIAIEVAIRRHSGSRGPVHSMRWRPTK